MWPFRKKQVLPPPDDVILGEDHASYSAMLDGWYFEIDGLEFSLSGREFDIRAFTWARASIPLIKKLDAEIDKRVLEVLDRWLICDVSTRQLFSVGLDDYLSERHLNLSYAGDDSWADFGVNIILANGQVIGSYGGD